MPWWLPHHTALGSQDAGICSHNQASSLWPSIDPTRSFTYPTPPSVFHRIMCRSLQKDGSLPSHMGYTTPLMKPRPCLV